MTCAHQITNGTLTCTRTDEHDEAALGGHTYTASSDDLGDHGRHSDEGGQG